MKLSKIKAFLEKQIVINKFKKEIAFEIIDYKKSISKKGGSTSIYLEEDCDLYIGVNEAVFILQEYKKNRLDKYYISYIVDALLLSERVTFESDEFLELFETLTDPDVNGNLSINVANELLQIFEKNK